MSVNRVRARRKRQRKKKQDERRARECVIRKGEGDFEGNPGKKRWIGTTTGRASSWKPNIQELPRTRD